MHDLAIRNAEICDGMGAATYAGAVALADGVISAIGREVESTDLRGSNGEE